MQVTAAVTVLAQTASGGSVERGDLPQTQGRRGVVSKHLASGEASQQSPDQCVALFALRVEPVFRVDRCRVERVEEREPLPADDSSTVSRIRVTRSSGSSAARDLASSMTSFA